VEGRVVFKDGSPCTSGVVFFEPLDASVKTTSRGNIHEDGTFFMSTDRLNDGVPEGHFRVRIAPVSNRHAGESPVHKKYWSDTSPLEYSVVQGKNEPTFEIDQALGKQRRTASKQ
jgi:hypothetical protein